MGLGRLVLNWFFTCSLLHATITAAETKSAPPAVPDKTNSGAGVALWISTAWPEFVEVAKVLREFSDQVKRKTSTELRIAWNGSRTSDAEAIKSLGMGRIDGMILSGLELAQVLPGVRQSESPLLYAKHREDFDAWAAKQRKTGEKEAASKGLKLLAVFDCGGIFLASRTNFASLKEIAGRTMWARPDDPMLGRLIEGIHGVPVTVPISGVKQALASKHVDVVWGPAAAFVALQWSADIHSLLKAPVSIVTGALFLSQEKWTKLSPATQAEITSLSTALGKNLTQAARLEDVRFLEAMTREKSIQIVEITKAMDRDGQELRAKFNDGKR